MKDRIIGLSLFLIGLVTLTNAQVISSQKSYLKVTKDPINTEEKKKINKSKDSSPPEIKLVSHELSSENTIETTDSEIVIIGRVSDKSEIISFMINSKVTEISRSGIFTAPMNLSQGSNEVVILALDNEDNFKNLRFTINYVPIKQTLAETVRDKSIYYGLIIGINNYPDPAINSLDNPINDAAALKKILTIKYNFEDDKIQYIPNAKREDIIVALDYLARQVTTNDNLLIFYAGHGYYDADFNIGYWLPSDAKKISKTDWFRNSTLVDYLKEINTKHTLLITDACFGGSIFQTRTAFTNTPKAIEMLYELPSRNAMTSGNLSEVPDQSSFAKFLLERLESNKEKYISSEQLFSSLRMAVMNNSDAMPKFGEIRNVGDQGGDFIFIKK